MSKNRVYSTFGGSLIAVGMRWTDRAIGIASMLILARLLMPEDFGVIAMAALVIGFADVLLNLGVHVPLIRDPHVTQEHYDSAWTIRLIQSVASGAVLIACAPWAAEYFKEPRIEPVVQVLAVSLLIGGLENIGTVEFQKKMQFGAEFRLLFAKRIIGFIAVIAAALVLRSYWALVVGSLAGSVAGVVLSYSMHPMRPRISFKRFREIFSISQWMLVANIGTYLTNSLHRMLIGRWSSAATMGAYTLADEISLLPSAELLAPMNRALFPAFAKVKDDLAALREKLLMAQAVQTLFAVPAAIGLALVAEEAVPVLLGENWRMAVPFLQILALVNVVQALASSGCYVLIVLGNIRASVLFMWAHVLVFGALALTMFVGQDAAVIAWLRLAVTMGGLCLLFWLVLRALPSLRVLDLVAVSWRPVVGAGLMALGLSLLSAQVDLPPVFTLGFKIVAGVVIYTLAVVLLWWLAGRRPGAESYVLAKVVEHAPVRWRPA